MKTPLPANEAERLEALRRYEILDTPPEQAFDDLTLLAAQICQTSMAQVSLVDKNRQWFKSKRGLSTTETSRDIAFCAHTILHVDEVLEVRDAQADPRFSESPWVTADPHVRFYAGAPLISPDGHALGALCVMDPTPRSLTDEQVAALRALSRRAVAQLELRRQARALAEKGRETEELLALAERSRRALLSVLEDEKLAGKNLRASEERFRGLIENSTDVITVLDAAGRIQYQSPSTQRVLGYATEELMGKAVLDFIDPEDGGKIQQGIERALAGLSEPVTVEFRIRHRNGTWRIFQSIGRSMAAANGEKQVVINSRDLTETRKLEQQFLRAQRLEALGTLSSGIAHDLNNILAPMLMIAPLLKEHLSEGQDLEMLTMIEQGAQRGANIIKQLLTFSRGVEGERGPVQARHLVKEMVEIMRETFPRDIAVVEKLQTNLRPITADATQIHQVLMNLCVNARDAMPNGGTITVTAQNLKIEKSDTSATPQRVPGLYVCLTVSDTGEGIAPENIDRIFEPFFTTKEVGKGTGLGLSTVLGIVKSHAGFVTVASEPGHGTTFTVHLPASLGPKEMAGQSDGIRERGQHELILVVDDEEPIRRSLCLFLVRENYRVLAAADGREALALFATHRHEVALVLTDIMMPGMNGVALIRALRATAPQLRIVAATGLHDHDRSEELAALGVKTVLPKPCVQAEILDALQREIKAGA